MKEVGWCRKGARLTCVLAFIMITANTTHAAQLHFKNGDRLKGAFIAMKQGERVVFRTQFGETIKVPWNNTDRLVNDKGKALIVASQNAQNNGQNQTAEVDETAQTEYETEPDAPSGFAWSGAVNLGAGFRTGNSETNSLNFDYTVSARREKQRFRSSGEYNRQEDEEDVTVDNRKIRFRHNYFFRENWFTNTSTAFAQDDIADLELRTTLGFGVGHQPYDTDTLKLEYVASLDHLREDFENEQVDQSVAGEWDLSYEQRFLDDLLRLSHNQSLLVPSDDPGAYILDTATALRVPLRKGLMVSAEIQYDRDNDPPAGIDTDDTLYALKLGYEW